MIDPKLLTPEHGFQAGVVVEIMWFPPNDEENRSKKEIFYWEGLFKEHILFLTDFWGNHVNALNYEITSIRPLTGPLSIWNSAPPWANYWVCRQDRKSCGFQVELVDYMRRGPHAEKYASDWSPRPWWSEVKEEKNQDVKNRK